MAKPKVLMARVGLDTREFETGLRRLDKKLRDLGTMGKVASDAMKIFAAATTAAAAATTVAAVAMTKAGLAAIDAQAKLSRSLAGTIDGLRGLQIAGGDAGVKVETVNDAAYKLTARLGEIQRQGGPAAKVLADLGLNAAQLASLDIDQRFAAIADAMQEAGLSASQQADALRVLGIEQKEVVQLFQGGGDAIRAARQEVDAFGLSVSAIDATKVEMANDAMARIGRSLEGVRNALAIAVAPMITEVSERLSELAKNQGGFSEATTKAAEQSGRALGKLADVAQGLRVVFKGVELVGIGFGAAVVSAVQLATEAVNKLVDGTVSATNAAIVALNKLPGVELELLETDWSNSEGMKTFRRIADELRNKVGETRSELHDLAMQPMPSAQVEEFFAAVRDRANEAAQQLVEARARAAESAGGMAGFGGTRPEGEADREKEAEERQRLMLEGRLQTLREHYMTETELENLRYAEQLNLLQDAEDARIATIDEVYGLREQAESEHQKRMSDIVKAEADKRADLERRAMAMTVDSLIKGLGQAFEAISSSNKKRFEQAKAFAKAEAALNAFRAIQQVWADETLPFYAKIAATAVTALQTAANISAINSTQFGGGTTPSAAGTPTVNGAPVQQAAQDRNRGPSVIVNLSGESHSTSAVRELLERIQDTVNDGGQIVLSPG